MAPDAESLILALDVVREVQAARDLEGYRRAVLRVRELVPCNAIGYNEVDARTGDTFAIVEPFEQMFQGFAEAFSAHSHQHPVIRHHAETGDESAHSISDFLAEGEFHDLDLYREFFALVDAEDQLSFILPSPPGMIVGVAMNRASRGFSQDERELVELVRPHLSQAFRDTRAREEGDPLSPARLKALGLSGREAEVMRLVVDGRSASDVAEELVISVHTARNHISSSYEKLGVNNRASAVAALLR